MRNNVKIKAPSLFKDFGLGRDVLCLAMDSFETEVIIKRSKSDNVVYRGKYKSSILDGLVAEVLSRFRDINGISDAVDIVVYCRVPLHFSAYASIVVALYQGLAFLFHTGKTHEDLYAELIMDDDICARVSKHELYAILYGGLTTAIARRDLYQKIYTPPGFTGVLFTPRSICEKEPVVLAPSYLSNMVLALNNSNFKVLGSGFKTESIEAFSKGVALSSDTIGIFPHRNTNVLTTLSLNTSSVDEDMKIKIEGYEAVPLNINLQGVQYY